MQEIPIPEFKSTQIIAEADKYYLEGGSNKYKALDLYKKYLTIKPNDIKANFNTAKILVNYGRHREAIVYYDKLLELDPDNAIYQNNKAYSLDHIGKLDEAEKNYY